MQGYDIFLQKLLKKTSFNLVYVGHTHIFKEEIETAFTLPSPITTNFLLKSNNRYKCTYSIGDSYLSIDSKPVQYYHCYFVIMYLGSSGVLYKSKQPQFTEPKFVNLTTYSLFFNNSEIFPMSNYATSVFAYYANYAYLINFKYKLKYFTSTIIWLYRTSLNYYTLNAFELYYKHNTKLRTISDVILNLKVLLKKAKIVYKFVKRNNYIHRLFNAFICINTELILTIFKKILRKENFKRHKKLINFFFYVIFRLYRSIRFHKLVKGIVFEVKGKIGVGGNSKTRKKVLYCGNCSLTKKSEKLNYKYTNVITQTGTLGLKLFISY